MKTRIKHTWILLAALSFYGCNEEIISETDGKETAVVYGLLSESDSNHFIRINRAFFGGGNSLAIAQVADSSYFKQVDAVVKEIKDGTVTRTWNLKDTLIENKEPGAFYYPQQKVYYFQTTPSEPLIADSKTIYRLEATINGGEFVVRGETLLVSGMLINKPKESSQFSFANADVEINDYSNTSIDVNTGNASRIELNLTVSFNEFIGSDLYATKSFEWKIRDFEGGDLTGVTVSGSAAGQTFYELIKQNASSNPAITKRQLKEIVITENGAHEDLQKYLLVNKPTSSLTQSKPIYTNLTATNENRVLGVFSSRGSSSRIKPDWVQVASTQYRCLNKNSTKELCLGKITGSLFFCSDNPADGAEAYFCN